MGLFDKFKRKKKDASKHKENSVQEIPMDDIRIEQEFAQGVKTGKKCGLCEQDIHKGNKVTFTGTPYHKWCLRKIRKHPERYGGKKL